MDRLARLVEELEARTAEADRVASLARWMAQVDRRTVDLAAPWLVVGEARHHPRPPRLALADLATAAADLSAAAGQPRWQFAAGLAAADDPAEGIALMMGPAVPPRAADVAAAHWLAAWRDDAAAADPRHAAACLARLPDALARRWAVRAMTGAARPLVNRGAWLRAWAAARGEDARALAWQLHLAGDAHALLPGEGLAPAADGGWPRPADARIFQAPDDDTPNRPVTTHAEHRWPGWPLQVAAHAGRLALWRADGELLNGRLPPTLLAALAALDAAALAARPLEAVLLAWDPAHGRALASEALARAGALEAAARASGASATRRAAPALTLHLALVGLAIDDARLGGPAARQAWATWPPEAAHAAARSAVPPPAVFVATRLPLSAATPDLPRRALTGLGAIGRVLRVAPDAPAHPPAGWLLRPPPHRLLGVLQYLPSDWWRLGADPDPRALAAGEAGVALWALTPPAPPQDIPLLPLARLPLATLSPATLRALHAAARTQAVQRFGGVAQLAQPFAVMEIAFDTVLPSRRHRIGAVLPGARLVGWRAELEVTQAHDLQALRSLDDPAG